MGWFFVAKRCAFGIVRAELDIEEIIFAEHVGHVFSGPVEELEELLVGDEMPIAADDGDVGATLSSPARFFWNSGPRLDPTSAMARLRVAMAASNPSAILVN